MQVHCCNERPPHDEDSCGNAFDQVNDGVSLDDNVQDTGALGCVRIVFVVKADGVREAAVDDPLLCFREQCLVHVVVGEFHIPEHVKACEHTAR